MKRFIILLTGFSIFMSCQNSAIQTSEQTASSINDTIVQSQSDNIKLIAKEYSWIKVPLILMGYVEQNPIFKSWKSIRIICTFNC